MKLFKPLIPAKALYFLLLLFLGCDYDEPYYGATDEKVVDFWNKTKNQYRVSMVKNDVVLQSLLVDSLKKNNNYYLYDEPRFSVNINCDSTKYYFDNLKTLTLSEVVLYYVWKREKHYEPENSLRIKVLAIQSNLPEKIEVDSSLRFSDYQYNFYPLILTIE